MTSFRFFRSLFYLPLLFLAGFAVKAQNIQGGLIFPDMYFGDTDRIGVPFAKDPHVIKFGGRYLMYYSVPASTDPSNPLKGWGLGIAESRDLTNWVKIGEVTPVGEYESKGIAAPSAIVLEGKVHLFYQTYGNWTNDAICHAVSSDGLHFDRNPTNPVFKPKGAWCSGRAIDAEIVKTKDKFLLYYATRDPQMQVQMIGVASAPLGSDFSSNAWIDLSNKAPILKPEYPWEGKCVEGASVIRQGNGFFMFYAGGYNNSPQQIGVARSNDGIVWEKLSPQPFLPNGNPGSWNSSESGHPHLFKDLNGKTYLFYQGNADNGKTWYISKLAVRWKGGIPYLAKPYKTKR